MKQFDLFRKKEQVEEAEIIEEQSRLQKIADATSAKAVGLYKHFRENPADLALIMFIALGMDISNTLDDISEV